MLWPASAKLKKAGDDVNLFARQLLYRRVSWCISGSGNDCYDYLGRPVSSCHHLKERLTFSNIYSLVAAPYQLSRNINNHFEENALDTILRAYQQDLSLSFSQDRLYFRWRFRKLSEIDYFFFTLDSFLSRHECDSIFEGQEMRTTIESKRFDDSSDHIDTVCLTDFGIIYAKLHYLARVYCVNSPSVTLAGGYSRDAAFDLREKLDTGIFTVSYLRP